MLDQNNEIVILPKGTKRWIIKKVEHPGYVTCPDCNGKKKHKIILGCGDEYYVKCHLCGPGYSDSTGLTEIFNPNFYVVEVIISKLAYYQHYSDGKEFSLRYRLVDGSEVSSELLFESMEEAESKISEKIKEELESLEKRKASNIIRFNDDNSFSVSYARKRITEKKKDLESAERYLEKYKNL